MINKAKIWFFGKTHKIDRPLRNLLKEKREKLQIKNVRTEKGDKSIAIRRNFEENKRILRTISSTYLKTWM